MKTGSQLLTQFFVYDFSKTGGDTGTQLTGIQLPNIAIITYSYFRCDAVMTDGGGGARMQVGTSINSSLIPVLITPGAMNVIGNFLNADSGLAMDNSLNIILTIIIAPFTAGRLTGFLQYYLFQ